MFKKLCREFPSPIEAERHFSTLSSQSQPSLLVESAIPETSQTPQAEPVLLLEPSLIPSISTCSPSTATPLLDTVAQARSVCTKALDHLQVKDQLLVGLFTLGIAKGAVCTREVFMNVSPLFPGFVATLFTDAHPPLFNSSLGDAR